MKFVQVVYWNGVLSCLKKGRYLADLTLLLLRDACEAPMWLDRWAISYPIVQMATVSGSQSVGKWRQIVAEAYARCGEQQIMLVAHGVAANAVLAWYYHSDVLVRKRIVGVLLVAPLQSLCCDEMEDAFERVRFNGKAALVVGQNDDLCALDWARERAVMWRMRLFCVPHHGHLNAFEDGWQWGMKLMQEMVLA
ncbi:MAG: alpha/beta hydrolase [Alysiella sp.]|uniref:alpha/beta hydrolase n=1 Tax=Alysiella sp. TaxID=1872483 RepID=UPI0026DBD115|nr:alpha/beta hydrolase [Alysiella sp.]MDO4434182.1 alpha/beta hydrolase [Alysiella sp.]